EENDPYKLSYENKNNPKRILDIIIEANRDVNKFVKLVVDTFSNYKDTADYQLNNGRVINVGFYKRAQLLAHDLYLLYQYYHKNNPEVIEKESFLKYLDFKNIDNLTAFADYKLPQFLHNKGIITYSEDLLNDIKNGKLINSKDVREVEIRAATVVAVDELASKTKTYPAFVDNVLWNLAKSDANSLIYPHHKTLTIYY
ncbi:MAG: queuosine salvage family protein, partial [bacterium]